MPDPDTSDLIGEAQRAPWPRRLAIYTRLSGPGWLQGAITLGGGSLAGSLYLGLIAGYGLLWLQPLAMVCGVITLSAIAYVTLSTGERPFGLINRTLSPALGWAWLIATIMANVVWSMPQFNLGVAALQQNLVPGIGTGAVSTAVIGLGFLGVGLACNALYSAGGSGLLWFERLLKLLVALIVVAFFLVVGTLAARGGLDGGAIFRGFLPNPANLFAPSPVYEPWIEQTGAFSGYWRETIAGQQRDRIIAAFGTAVGINMTFLLPYTMLKKRWGRERRGLAVFDLSIGLIVPFVLATTCVVIASAASFHGQTGDVLDAQGRANPAMAGPFHQVLDARLGHELGDGFARLDEAEIDAARSQAPDADRQLAAMLANRDNFNLANTLEPLAGKTVAQTVFGVGVLGMAVSTLIVLMMMNGFAFQEMFNRPDRRGVYLAGCAVAGIGGFLGPFVWSHGEARAALAIPTSVIGGSLLPIACFAFFLLMNSRGALGDAMPRGAKRWVSNGLLVFASAVTTFGSVWVLSNKGAWGAAGIVLLIVLAVLGVIGFVMNKPARPFAK